MLEIRKIMFFAACCLSAMSAQAQYNFEAVFPNLSGAELETAVKDNFRPNSVLNYSVARDSMFRNVYGVNNTLSCVYTGHTLPMPLGQDATEVVFMNGSPGGINTEHSWPRSYGAENGNPKSDMHHLYPTRVDVNSDRGTLPFLEVPDAQANSWYFMSTEQANIPGANIDLYSERSGSAFEPREDHKGNVARAMMYFKAIYPQEAMQAPAGFWDNMAPTLCQWHGQDPIDSLEWHRSWIIASYQNNKPNPFVLDCSLAERMFCPSFSGICDPTVSVSTFPEVGNLKVFPNPASDLIQIDLSNFVNNGPLSLVVINSLGRHVLQEQISKSGGEHTLSLVNNSLAPGWYICQVRSKGKIATARFILR